MGVKQTTGQKQRLQTRIKLIAAVSSGVVLIMFFIFSGYFTVGVKEKAMATTNETLSTGSFIINMGITPQTISNGLRPYGMIYDLIKNYNVPVKWVIEPTKLKDQPDFTHNSVTYRGGTFIIPAEFISPAVAATIENWRALGVSGNYSVSSITVPVYSDITSFPKIMIDNLSGNDSIIAKYYNNASIPSSAYEINAPSNLSECHDMWVNPHGDPTWATHQYLYDFVTTKKSYIWMQCHAVSMMEACQNTLPPFTQLNYLSTNGLQCYMAGKCGLIGEVHAKALPTPIAYFHPTDPVMQFMGAMSSVALGGSERWFRPLSSGAWRGTTKVLATAGSFAAPKQGVIMVYGPAFGDSNNGLVMYTGGHDMNSGSANENVSAQRSFFNFLLLAGKAKAPVISADVSGTVDANHTDTFSVTMSGGLPPYIYTWSSSAGGTFSSPNDSITAFTPWHTTVPMETIITCVVTDACGRRNFYSLPVHITASSLPISLIDFKGTLVNNGNVALKWSTASEINNNYFTVSRSDDGRSFTPWKNVPSQGNSSNIQSYYLNDEDPLQGVSYYKLSQTDFDGTKKEVGNIKVNNKKSSGKNSKISVAPNPFQDAIRVSLTDEYIGSGKVCIWNASGKMVSQTNYTLTEGNNEVELESLENLPKGTYILRVIKESLASEGIKLMKN